MIKRILQILTHILITIILISDEDEAHALPESVQ